MPSKESFIRHGSLYTTRRQGTGRKVDKLKMPRLVSASAVAEALGIDANRADAALADQDMHYGDAVALAAVLPADWVDAMLRAGLYEGKAPLWLEYVDYLTLNATGGFFAKPDRPSQD